MTTLQDQVTALVTSVGSLLAAVSVTKAELDAAAASSQIAYRVAKFNILGALTQGPYAARWYPERAVTLTGVKFSLAAAPYATASIDVLVNGVSALSGNYATVQANQNVSNAVALNIAILPTDYVQVAPVAANGQNALVTLTYL
jgi:hypothetical protein